MAPARLIWSATNSTKLSSEAMAFAFLNFEDAPVVNNELFAAGQMRRHGFGLGIDQIPVQRRIVEAQFFLEGRGQFGRVAAEGIAVGGTERDVAVAFLPAEIFIEERF